MSISDKTDNNTAGRLRSMTSIYLTCDGKILLLYRQGSRVINDVWVGSAGGHFEPHELNDAKSCVLRELYEELRITEEMLDGLALRYVTLRRTPNEIRQNYYFFAELSNAGELPLASDEGKLQWFALDELERSVLPMPFTARGVISHWLSEGRLTEKIYAGIANDTEVLFSELPAF